MATTLVHHRVADYEAWKAVYDSVEPMQRSAGVRSHRVWRDHNDPSMVVVEHVFDSLEAAEEFAESPDLREAMGRAGVDPSSFQVEFLEEAASGTF